MSISDQQFLDWQKADATRRTLLVECDPYVGAAGAGAITTRYLSNRGYITGPSETPANISYEDRITATPAFTVRMSELLLGRSSPSWGDLELFNGDGLFDSWLDDGWDGIAIRVYLGDASWTKSDFRLVATLTASAITARDTSTLAVKIKDFQRWLDVPLTTETMGIGPNANSPKPVAYGLCRNITPICESTSSLKYRVNAFEVQSIDRVRDNGVPVSFTPDLADGSFVLGSSPSGAITCDVSSGGRSFSGTEVFVSPDIINASAHAGMVGNGNINTLSRAASTLTESIAVIFTSATSANVSGTVNQTLPAATVGTPYTSIAINFTLTAGGVAFVAGDRFDITIQPSISVAQTLGGVGGAHGNITFTASTHSVSAASGTPFNGLSYVKLLGATNKQNNGYHRIRSTSGGGANAILESKLVDEVATGLSIYGSGGWAMISNSLTHNSIWSGYLMRRIIERHTGLTTAQLGVSYYDLPPQAAFYSTSGATVAEALDKIATAAIGFYSFDESGVLYAGLVKDPSTLTATASIIADEIELQSLRVIRDIPAYSGVKLKLEKNWTMQTNFAGAVTDANRAKWTGTHYSLTTSSASNSSKYPLAVERQSADDDVLAYDRWSTNAIETFSYSYDVDVKATLVALFGVARRVYAFNTKSAPHTLRLGQAVNLTHPAYGFDAGVNALVVGIVRNFSTGLTTLEVMR